MNGFIKKTLIFIFLIAVTLVISFYINATLYKDSQIIKNFENALSKDNNIILFGSSVNEYVAPTDTDYRSVSDIVNYIVKNHNVTGVSHPAYHPEMYIEFIKKIAKSGKKITVVVPINLRYFSPEWNMRPSYQFIKIKYKMIFIPHYLNLKNFPKVSASEFNNYPIYLNDKQIGTVKDFDHNPNMPIADTLQKLRTGFIYHYMQPINPDNRKLKSLVDICKLCEKNDIKLFMYFTPIDINRAEEFKIEGFREQQLKNIKIIEDAIKPYNFPYINLSLDFDSSYFDYYTMPNEHMNMYGKQKLANEIVKLLGDDGL